MLILVISIKYFLVKWLFQNVHWAISIILQTSINLNISVMKISLSNGISLYQGLLINMNMEQSTKGWYHCQNQFRMHSPGPVLMKLSVEWMLNYVLNTLRQRQNGRHFADDTFKCIFLNENVRILIKISLKFVPKGPINNIPSLILIMAWRQPGAKPLSEPIMVRLLTHICVTWPQWVNHPRLLAKLSLKPCIHNLHLLNTYYRKTSSISRPKSQSLNVSCILKQLSSFNPLKPGVKLRMKM